MLIPQKWMEGSTVPVSYAHSLPHVPFWGLEKHTWIPPSPLRTWPSWMKRVTMLVNAWLRGAPQKSNPYMRKKSQTAPDPKAYLRSHRGAGSIWIQGIKGTISSPSMKWLGLQSTRRACHSCMEVAGHRRWHDMASSLQWVYTAGSNRRV